MKKFTCNYSVFSIFKERHHSNTLNSPTQHARPNALNIHQSDSNFFGDVNAQKPPQHPGALPRGGPHQRARNEPPPPPIYQPANNNNGQYGSNTNLSSHPYGLPQHHHLNMSNAVNSIVDTWEADLAKHVKRRPSGQLDQCNQNLL